MSEDRGDDISPEQAEFLLYQNAMAELGVKLGVDGGWWDLTREGFQHVNTKAQWIGWFKRIAEQGDPRAIELITKVTKLRLRQ